MSDPDTTAEPVPDDGPERTHPQEPAEGADEDDGAPTERVHPQEPAEGADDPEVTGE